PRERSLPVDGGRMETEPLPALPAEPVIEGPDDTLRRFVEETLRPATGARVSASELFAAYERWGEPDGLEPLHATAFGRRMGEILAKARKGGRCCYLGVAVVPTLQLATDKSPRRV